MCSLCAATLGSADADRFFDGEDEYLAGIGHFDDGVHRVGKGVVRQDEREFDLRQEVDWRGVLSA